uniref:Ig-like domain-containing protein n=1 Tax=Lates calcarifer TaxID=8187 RepID=A0A4W6F9Z5_LATCA
MIVLWVTLLVLHHGCKCYFILSKNLSVENLHDNSLVPVITVHLGESVTFTCVLPDKEGSRRSLYWYKQSAGDTLKSIVTVFGSTKPEYAPGFLKLRLEVKNDKKFSNLTIVRTIHGDEGMYHCAVLEWNNATWSGTYLSVKGKCNLFFTFFPRSTVSDSYSMTLQCSVLSGSKNKTCSGDHNVYWFRAGSDKSHPNIVYTDGNKPDECQKKPDAHSPPKSCVYHFSKTVSSSDPGTYYCAVATCGEIIFGNGTKLEIEVFIAMGILIICLTISVIGNVILICNRRVREQSKTEDKLNYVALNFSERKATRGRQRREFAEDSVYSQVRC